MRLVKIMERGGEDYRDYKKALKKVKEGVDVLCELTEEMEDQYSSRGGYSSRSKRRSHHEDDEWDD